MAGLQGRALGGYQLTAQLSSGGVAEVYRATPTQAGGREAIVKVIYPEFARQNGFRARFDQIVQIGRRLNHPHILPLLASGEQNGYLYIVTPFVAAGTLKDWIVGGKRLGTHDVGPFFRQVCEAVGYAHSQSVVHGNIKPSNIFLFEGRHVLLGDFGRLWDVGQMDMTHAGPGIEAVEFLAPESTEGRADQRSDIYGLGAVLYASLTGVPPFRGNTPFEVLGAHARQAPPQLGSARPPVEPGVLALDPVVQKALAKAPDARFPSALALAQAVEGAVRGAPHSAGGPARVASPLSAGSPVLGKASFPPLPAGLVDPGMEEGGF
ncbi:MAG TPA: serine/threonine-protein kinase, partial [Ktedonobacterales bacterium]|nr:serine/threonine-protein kinase [Ktedonobacterales bacterium]